MRISIAIVLALLGALGFAVPARADHLPLTSSDGFFIGVRVGPDSALSLGYDFDYYLDRRRIFSLGPAAAVALLGTHAPAGQHQELMLTVDVLELKVQVSQPGVARPYFFGGVGFDYVSLASATQTFDVTLPGSTTAMHATREVPATHGFEGMWTLGFGLDLFTGGPWALSIKSATHFGLASDRSRVPFVWSDISVGFRFGV